MRDAADRIYKNGRAEKADILKLLSCTDDGDCQYLFEKAREVSQRTFGKNVYIRGLIEFTSYCKNDCLYCGLRKSNSRASRYRLTDEEILQCCESGYNAGFRTFVLQGGDDMYYTPERMCELIKKIKAAYPDCALTLSVGEKPPEVYEMYYKAGADRYLLRHETAVSAHYSMLHPEKMRLETRLECLKTLKEIGFQTGAGFMVGSPYQTDEFIAEDIMFLQDFKPHMIGIGPFLPHKDTPFRDEKGGSVLKTLIILAIVRLTNPLALLPSTTALATAEPGGRERGILAGANVVMPNLSPANVREKYLLYNGKLCTGFEAAENKRLLEQDIAKIGYTVVSARGDSPFACGKNG